MSIYATLWILKFPKFGEYHNGCKWTEVTAQGVPPHIGTPTAGFGYERGDPYADFLPPAVEVSLKGEAECMRAVVFVTEHTRKGTPRSGQEYVNPLLTLSGKEYASLSFDQLHQKICDALRGHRPRVVFESINPDGTVTVQFEDGTFRSSADKEQTVGMYDTVYVSSDVAAAWSLHCVNCHRTPKPDVQWQTKAFDPCMHSYFLRYDEGSAIRLYLLDRPSARRFWRAFTAEEIAESERIAAERGGLFAAWKKKPGDGYFLPEAFLPEHRRQRFMGELPHQWVEIYHSCECSEFIQYWIKFSDGIAVECGTRQPALGQGFFDDASEFDL